MLQRQKGLYICGKKESLFIDSQAFDQTLQDGGEQMYGSSLDMVNTLKDKVRELLQDKKFQAEIDIHWTTSGTNQ